MRMASCTREGSSALGIFHIPRPTEGNWPPSGSVMAGEGSAVAVDMGAELTPTAKRRHGGSGASFEGRAMPVWQHLLPSRRETLCKTARNSGSSRRSQSAMGSPEQRFLILESH